MRITMLVSGSRGDIQPHIAFALALRDRGHTIVYGTHDFFAHAVTSRGIEFASLAGDPREGARILSTSGPDRVEFMKRYIRFYRSTRDEFEADVRRACRGADIVIHNNFVLSGWYAANEAGIPSILTAMQPVDSGFSWRPFRERERQRRPILYGFSPLLLPRPPEWGPWIAVTGYWFLERPEDWRPPDDLERFVRAGDPPIAIGMGSMVDERPKELADLVLTALERTGRRAVLLSGWGGIGPAELPPNVYLADSVPYDWLFPRVSAAVHHGGLGSIAEALRAGIPSVCVPYYAEQFFWGPRLEQLGASPPVVPRSQLTAARLAESIDVALSDPAMRRRVRRLGAELAAEDGVGAAVDSFERLVGANHGRSGAGSASLG